MRRERRITVALFAAGLAGASCWADLSGLTGEGEADGGFGNDAGDATLADGQTDANAVDAGGEADGGDGGDAGPVVAFASCAKPHQGGAMVDAGGLCIDATEVTQGDYAAFLAANVPLDQQIAVCAWNASFAPLPSVFTPTVTSTAPVTGVDWCDAQAFCRWAGKRLCGRIGGGSITTKAESSNPAVDQWFAACSNHGTRAYPYGATYAAGTCNDSSDAAAPASVESFPACVGGVPGLFDMSGNVGEWQDFCGAEQPDPSTTSCNYRGGDWDHTPTTGLDCAYLSPAVRKEQSVHKGFRCCAD